jgi:hypothetical protein
MLAFHFTLAHVLKWPGFNVAFLFSLGLTLALTFAIIPYGKRRPAGAPLSWGQAMVGAVYAFAVMFLAYGVVPNQWLLHVGSGKGWRGDRIVFGPGDILKPKVLGGPFPFTINYLQVGDAVVTVIYVFFLGLHVYMWSWWQNRHKPKAATKELAVSAFGRPLLRKG